jgi:prevent-host-death family protein
MSAMLPALDPKPYSIYMSNISRSTRIDIKTACSQFVALLAEAERGRSTIVTRRGRPIAAVVPVDRVTSGLRQKSLLGLAGSGKGLWGETSAKALRRLRDEWQR